MKRMMDVRERILRELERKPDDTFTITAIARAIGITPKAANAALSRLFNKGMIARPQKGIYSSKGRLSETPAASSRAHPTKRAASSKPAVAVPISVVSIDLLVEGDQSQIDTSAFLGKLREIKSILDARVREIKAADQTKLKIRFSFPEED